MKLKKHQIENNENEKFNSKNSNTSIFGTITLFFTSCNLSKHLVGVYRSDCKLHAQYALVMTIEKERRFEYKLAYIEDTITGSWCVIGDTLILSSPQFKTIEKIADTIIQDVVIYGPNNRYTSFDESKDMFLIKRKFLQPLNDLSRDTKGCPIKKVN